MKIFVLLISLFSASCFAQQSPSSVPSHCVGGEQVLLTAKLKKVISNKNGQGFSEIETDKFISLCGNSSKDNISVIFYRFGKIGNIELKREFNKNSPLNLTSVFDKPFVSNVMMFHSGSYAFYIDRSLGGGSPVSLTVKQNGKEISRFMSRFDDLDSPMDDFLESIDLDTLKTKRKAPAIKISKFDY